MASQIKVDQIAGAAGSTVTIPAGQTLDVLGTLDIDAGTLVLPNTVVTTTGTQTLTNKTLTSPVISTIVSVSNGDVELAPNGTGHAVVKGNTNPGILQLNCEQNSHGQQIKAAPHSEGATNVLTLPSTGGDARLVSTASTATLTNKTLTAPKIGTSILDSSGNELFLLTATGSAVNQLTYANAATGNNPTFTASGGDTNIGISILPKGSGKITLDNLTLPAADGSANQILTTNGSGQLSFVDNSGGTSWVAVKTANYTASAGEGVFANTTGGAFTLTLPAGTLGDEISFIDYAGTFDSNALTIASNGSEKINGSTDNLTVSVERAANTLVYTDGTQGWLLKNK